MSILRDHIIAATAAIALVMLLAIYFVPLSAEERAVTQWCDVTCTP